MSIQATTFTPIGSAGVADSSTDRRHEPRAWVGVRVERQTTPAGVVQLQAMSDHRLKIHAGAPVRGACRDRRFLYTRGDIDILPAGLSDVWQEDDSNTSLILQLSPSLLRRTAEELGADPDVAGLEPRHQFRDPQIEYIAWALDAERAAGNPGGLLYTETLGSALAIHLLGRYAARLHAPRGFAKPQLLRITEYIEEHLDQDLSLSRLADVAGVSTSQLKKSFKHSTGLPVHEYVIQRRVQRAKRLLQEGGLTSSQVALEAGFAHQSHMARCMRKTLGATPTVLRRGWASFVVPRHQLLGRSHSFAAVRHTNDARNAANVTRDGSDTKPWDRA
jgi:AraC family transcriptional regulator